MTRITLATGWGDHPAGSTINLDRHAARALIYRGTARPAAEVEQPVAPKRNPRNTKNETNTAGASGEMESSNEE